MVSEGTATIIPVGMTIANATMAIPMRITEASEMNPAKTTERTEETIALLVKTKDLETKVEATLHKNKMKDLEVEIVMGEASEIVVVTIDPKGWWNQEVIPDLEREVLGTKEFLFENNRKKSILFESIFFVVM